MDDYLKTVISQYFDSTTIRALLEAFNQWKSPQPSIELLYNGVLNLDTARGYGLDRWGRIVGVGRVFNVAAGTFFGFAEAQDIAESPFNNDGCFWSGGPTTVPTLLSDNGFLTLILAKAMANITDGSTASYNQILMALFGDLGPCFVVDGLDMTGQYRFLGFFLPPLESAVFYQSGVIPHPAGVQMTVVEG
jgi:hypothetical protein